MEVWTHRKMRDQLSISCWVLISFSSLLPCLHYDLLSLVDLKIWMLHRVYIHHSHLTHALHAHWEISTNSMTPGNFKVKPTESNSNSNSLDVSPGGPTHLPTFQYRKPVIFPQIASSSFILCLLAKGVLFCFCFSVNPYIQLSLPSKSQLTHGQVSIFASGCKSEHFRETKPTMCVCAHTDVFRCTHH